MDKKLKAKWVKALRSGRYKQGQCNLYQSQKRLYCCLGVLGRVMGKSTEELAKVGGSIDIPAQWGILSYDDVNRLTRMNDCDVASFKRIADHIEEKL